MNERVYCGTPRGITRREAVRTLSLATLLAMGAWPGALRARDKAPRATEPFRFAVINDTHYRTPECGPWLARVVEQMRAERPEFCLMVGDLVDVGTRENHVALRDVFAQLGVPVHVVLGNHDYATQEDRRAFEDIHPQCLNYRFERRGWQFIGLDSTEGVHWQNTRIPVATLRWVANEAPNIDRDQPLVLFTHFPLAAGVKMQPLNADALLEPFRDHNVQAVFNGHFHGFTEHTFQHATVTTNRCCGRVVDNHDGTHEKGFFVCDARDGRIERRFVPLNFTV